MVGTLATDADGPGFKTFMHMISQKLSVLPAGRGH